MGYRHQKAYWPPRPHRAILVDAVVTLDRVATQIAITPGQGTGRLGENNPKWPSAIQLEIGIQPVTRLKIALSSILWHRFWELVKGAFSSNAESPQDAILLDHLMRAGFVVLPSVGSPPGAAHGPDG